MKQKTYKSTDLLNATNTSLLATTVSFKRTLSSRRNPSEDCSHQNTSYHNIRALTQLDLISTFPTVVNGSLPANYTIQRIDTICLFDILLLYESWLAISSLSTKIGY